VLTVISIMMAGLSISIDMGRPDRIFNIILYWPQRVATSPLSWDVTVIIIYFTLSTCFLWLTLRQDMAHLAKRFPKLGLIYKPLLLGYKPGEEEKIERMAWWLSLTICFLIVMLSGGVVAWIFGLLPSRPGWYSAMMGPYFLTAAISSAIAAVMVVAGVIRKALGWEKEIKAEVFSSLGTFLGIVTFAYMYLVFTEQLTNTYAGPLSEFMVSEMMLTGQFAPVFWPMIIFGFITPATYLCAQAIFPRIRSANRSLLAAAIILVAFWVKRFLIVVPSLLRPLLPFPSGTYAPSWVEWSVVAGTFAASALLFMVFIKIFPIMEVVEEKKHE
jgi:Ni/Fe-hydrogenase subunit HybB-like protein